MAKRSFFSDMRFIDSEIQQHRISSRGESIFESLVEFIEDCSFSKSRHYKFICKHWRLGYDSLQKIWDDSGYKHKNQEAFRVQASCLSRMLYALFPSFSRELFILDLDEDSFQDIETTISVLGQTAGFPDELFISAVTDYPDNLRYEGDMSAEDCLATMGKLKPLLKAEVFEYLDGLDLNHIKYILSTLKKPVFGVRLSRCNKEKITLLKTLGASCVQLEEHGQDKVIVKERRVEVPEKTQYNLSFTKRMADILTECAGAKMTIEETKEFLKMTEKERDMRKICLAKVLRLFTEEGFKRQLSHYSPIEINEVLNGNYLVGEGESIYRFMK